MRRFLFIGFAVFGFWTGANATAPNIIFILADDLGGLDLSCYGSTFHETPNLDRLAAGGMRFTDAYAACNVCSPTRASILTGKHPARLGLTTWLPQREIDSPKHKLKEPVALDHLPLEEVTLAEALKEAGYTTGFIGKWHLGGAEFFPEKQGFDSNFGGCDKGHPPSYFSPYNIPNLPDGPKGEYLTDRLTDEALRFLEKQTAKPFLLYLSHYAVHTPLQAKPELIEKYKAKAAKMAPVDRPEFVAEDDSKTHQIQNNPIYAAMLQSLDESIGKILDKLGTLKLDKNTIIIFTSDNGGLATAQGHPTSNYPFRAGKGWNYEGGIREPLLVQWKGVIQPGSISHTPIMSTDYYPTLLEATGQPLRPQQHKDGVSFLPVLQGGSLPDRPLFWHTPHYSPQGSSPGGAMRLGDYKLVERFEENRVELYDLKKDIGEQHDLAPTMPEKMASLKKLLDDWRHQVNAKMTEPNPNYQKGVAPGKKKSKEK